MENVLETMVQLLHTFLHIEDVGDQLLKYLQDAVRLHGGLQQMLTWCPSEVAQDAIKFIISALPLSSETLDQVCPQPKSFAGSV